MRFLGQGTWTADETDVGGVVSVEGVRRSTAVSELCVAIKGSGCFPGFLRRCGAHPSSPLDLPLTSETSGLVLLLSVLSHGIPSQIEVILTSIPRYPRSLRQRLERSGCS